MSSASTVVNSECMVFPCRTRRSIRANLKRLARNAVRKSANSPELTLIPAGLCPFGLSLSASLLPRANRVVNLLASRISPN